MAGWLPHRRTLSSATTAPILFHLDHPESWSNIPRQLTVRGWVFIDGQGDTDGVRALINGQPIEATIGYHRPDVGTAYPNAPSEYTGFQIATLAPRGRFTITLQVRSINTSAWLTFFESVGTAPRWRLPFAFGGGSPAELLSGQLALIPQHAPRPITPERFPPTTTPPAELPLLTVVTPNFNQGPWLDACIRSVVEPADPNVHHIVRDGASTDESVPILQSHDHQLHAWVSEPDGGQADAIVRGFNKSEGDANDLMAWINADDHYLPGAIPFVRQFFADHPEVDVVYGNRVLINDAGEEVGRWHLPPHDNEVLKLYDFVPQETLFWRRRIWQKAGGIDPEFRFALDWDLLLRFQTAGAQMVHIPRFLAAFRLHASQKSAAQIGSVGQAEIDRLRRRTFGRDLAPAELINAPALERYLRRSARRQWAASLGIRPSLRL